MKGGLLSLKYDSDMIDQINESVNLVEYVNYAHQDLELESHGKELFAHCPKHVDETASLSFTPETNKFFCFSCHRGGGIIQFIKEYENLSYNDAVEKAARLAKIDMSKMCKSQTMLFLKRLSKLHCIQKKDEHKILNYDIDYGCYKKEQIHEWLDEGIKQDVIDIFDIRVDRFGNRIVYPVFDNDGNLINVKGRTRYLDYKSMKIPKYINYNPVGKLDYLQGINITRQNIKESGEVILFESIKSVMKAYGWGYKNCVSVENHNLTEEQIELLIKLRVNIVFAYDSDVSYASPDVKEGINKLKGLTNVFLIEDKNHLLGGKDSKNAPVDCGKPIWDKLYSEKRRVV